MLKTYLLVCVSLVLPTSALAGPIVTWEAVGEITRSFIREDHGDGRVPPPVGTPYSLTLTFDPHNTWPTSGAPSSMAGRCFTTSASAQFNLGGVAFTSGSGFAFTHGLMPGSACSSFAPHEGTDFFFLGLTTTDPNPWPMEDAYPFLDLLYHDRLIQDAFPSVPTPAGLGSLNLHNQRWEANGTFFPRLVVEQPASVPEPGTLTLFGLGLAAVVRRLRRA